MHWPKVIIAILIGLLIFSLSGDENNDNLLNIASVLATVSGTLLGFLFATLSILTSIANRRLIMNMKKSGHYQVLLKQIYYSATAFLIVLITSVATLFVKDFYLLIGVSTSSAIATLALEFFITAGYKFYIVMTELSN